MIGSSESQTNNKRKAAIFVAVTFGIGWTMALVFFACGGKAIGR